MKNLFIFLLLSTACSWMAGAKQVDENTARTAAGNFFAGRIGINQPKTLPTPVLACTSTDLNKDRDGGIKRAPAFYIFNFTNPVGFVIVSGNGACSPILGYSLEGSFQTVNIPPAVSWWLQGYEQQISKVVEKDLKATPETEAEWTALCSGAPNPTVSQKSTTAVLPLVKQNWDQSPKYNASCPKVGNDTCITGCVATSMAMIMAYHKHPVHGTGANTYTTETLKKELSVNFGNTTYQWNLMHDSLARITSADSIAAVATLMYHCGVSININYGVKETSGNDFANGNPDAPCTENALKNHFGYDEGLRQENRESYTPEKWIELLKTDLNASRPIIYTGGSHSFICDGYDNNNSFHFNWGWGGTDNGYFKLELLNPKENGGLYHIDNAVLMGIKKSTTGVEDKNLAGKLVACPNPARGIVEIRLSKGQGDDLQKIMVANMQGRNVYESAAKAENNRVTVDLSAFPQGNYLVTCYFKSGETASCKLLIER